MTEPQSFNLPRKKKKKKKTWCLTLYFLKLQRVLDREHCFNKNAVILNWGKLTKTSVRIMTTGFFALNSNWRKRALGGLTGWTSAPGEGSSVKCHIGDAWYFRLQKSDQSHVSRERDLLFFFFNCYFSLDSFHNSRSSKQNQESHFEP